MAWGSVVVTTAAVAAAVVVVARRGQQPAVRSIVVACRDVGGVKMVVGVVEWRGAVSL